MSYLPRTVVVLLAIAILGIAAEPVYAMHISEGILPMGWAVLWFLASLPFVVSGIEKSSH